MNTIQQQKLIESGLFDEQWYLARYPDARQSELTALEHFMRYGWALGRCPSAKFDPDYYRDHYADIALSGEDPLAHFLTFGIAEERKGCAEESLSSSRSTPAVTPVPTDSFSAASPIVQQIEPSKLAGDLNIRKGDVAIRGWLANRLKDETRTAVIRVNDRELMTSTACHYRADLAANGIHQGRHSFEIYPPLELMNGQEHRIELIDQASGQLIATANAVWQPQRKYTDFSGYLAHSLVNPFVPRPFREEDKRCFAAMENVARTLVERSQQLTNPPLVSVIMPCFNRMETIEQAVDSVLDQSYPHIELILVDDGSHDGTAQWCQKLASQHPRVHSLLLEQNSGVSHARNRGLGVAKGEYIMYLDSDNRWDTRYVAAKIGAFQQLPEAEALYSGLYRYHGDNAEPSGILFGALNHSLLFNRNYIDLNTFAHTRAAWQRLGGFDETLPRYVDWDLIRRYSLQASIYSVPVILTHYYMGKATNTLTANNDYSDYFEAVRQKTGNTYTGASTGQRFIASKKIPKLERGLSVVIPSYESLEDLRECLNSLYDLALGPRLEIIIVDNNSSVPVKSFISEEASARRIKAVFNDANYGFTYAVNRGMQAANAENDIVLLNNDSLVMAGALESLQQAAYSLPECGLVVPQQVLLGGTKTLNDHVPYADASYPCDVNISQHHDNIKQVPLFHDGHVLEITFAPFFCVYIPRHVYLTAGELDAQYGRHYRSDRIYCDVVRHILGLKIYHVSDALIYHKLQKSTAELADKKETDFDIIFKKNRWDLANKQQLGFIDAPWDV